MKKILLLLVLYMLYSSEISSQSICCDDSVRYLTAYRYIMKDKVNRYKIITVSDSIIDLDRNWFSEDELKDFPEKYLILSNYRIKKGFIWTESYYSDCLVRLFGEKNKQAKNVLFFSSIEDDILVADLLPIPSYKKGWNRFHYEEMAFQNTGRIYLFIFNKGNKFKAVFTRRMIYGI